MSSNLSPLASRAVSCLLVAAAGTGLPYAYAQVPPRIGLPNECVAAACGGKAFDPLRAISAVTATPNALRINQQAGTAILNWRDFNIANGNTVQFVQPSSGSVALNRIYDARLSTIDGKLLANGQVYLINPNGILFGKNARVDVAGLIASTLEMSDDRVTRGLLAGLRRGEPVAFGTAEAGKITIEPGAVLYAAGRDQAGTVVSAGRIFLFAPEIQNAGSVEVDGGGQVVFAAGRSVFLGTSTDPTLRGLLVEVKDGGRVDNAGSIQVARGNVTLMGLAVNQAGRITATSAIRENGSIRLIARETDVTESTAQLQQNTATALYPTSKTGTVALAPGSQTVVALDANDRGTAPLSDDFAASARSTIVIEGAQVTIGGNGPRNTTLVEARGGDIQVTARTDVSTSLYAYNDPNTATPSLLGRADPNAVVSVGSDARIDASGLRNVEVDGARNFIFIDRLTTNDLRDAPLQRDGFLKGKGVWLNIGTDHPFIDTSTRRAALPGTQAERNASGGTVALRAEGAVNVNAGATIDVSGGTINTTSAVGRTSQLITANGRVVDIMNASAATEYIGFADELTISRVAPREGVNQQQTFSAPRNTRVGGYSEGKSAGTVEIYAPGGRIDGTLVGSTTPSDQQRATLPAGGQLRIGSSASAPPELDRQAYLSRANIALGNDVAALRQSMADEAESTIIVDAAMLKEGGFTRLDLTSDGKIELASQSPLDLGPAGQLKAQANAISVASDITAAGGSIVLAERPLSALQDISAGADQQRERRNELNLVDAAMRGAVNAPNASFSTAGRWTNDFLTPASATPTSPRVLNGGTIDISGRSIDVSNARFDVSAGATVDAARKFSGGTGGNLNLALNQEISGIQSPSDTGVLKLGDRMAERVSAFGVSGGGRLSIGVLDALSVGSNANAKPGTLVVDPALANVGFSTYAFSAFNDAAIAPNTAFAPDVRLVRFEQPLLLAPSAERLAAVASPQAALPLQQKPATISVSTTNLLAGLTTIGTGAVVDAGVQGRVSVTGGASVLVEGALRAPAGTVDVALRARGSAALSAEEYAARVLEIGGTGSIDVSGTSQVASAADGTRTGNVLDAGTVSLNANSGYLVIAPEAKIAARGTSDVVTLTERGIPARDVAVASRGGAVQISADLGLYAQGKIDLQGGYETTEGGRLSIALNTPDAEGLVDPAALSLVGSERRLLISAGKPTVPASGQPVDAAFAGLGQVAPDTVNSSGADIAWLASGDAIAFDSPTSIATRSALGLDAQTIRGGKDASLTVASPYIAIGAGAVAVRGRINRGSPPTPPASAGTAQLAIRANDLDLVGDFSLQGIGDAKLIASADVRGIGTSGSGDRPAGALRFGGNVGIEAAQIYPTTFTDYVIESNAAASDLSNGRLTLARGAASPAPLAPLSAGGRLIASAAEVVVSGTVVAPLGAVELTGSRSVTLAAGAEVSVAGVAIVPFGTVANAATWSYSANPGSSSTTIASAQTLNVPSKEVRISAPTVDMQPGSRINLQGGGETRASEFVPGPGGSFDVSLNFPDSSKPTSRNTLFALLPARGPALAPFDPQAYRDLNLNGAASGTGVFRFGQTITLAAGSGLPAGTYTVLPASYALLPGAFAVQPVSGYQDLSPQSVLLQANGTFIVAGKLGFAAAGTEDARWSGFRVYSGEQFRKLAEFNTYSGDAFFAAASKAQGANTPRLAADAATLSIDGARVRLAGELAAAAAAGGRGAEVALSASNLVVSEQAAVSAAPQETLRLSTAQLSALNAETLVLGAAARRSADGETLTLTNAATSISVEGSTPLVAGEIILTAKDTVRAGPNSVLQANSTAAATPPTRALVSDGDGATLWVTSAAAEELTTTRNAASAPGLATRGTLEVAANTRISGRSVLFDASRSQSYAPGFRLETELATLSGATVNFGEIPVGTAGLNLTGDLLAQFGAAKRLSVASASGFTTYGSASVGAVDGAGRPVLDELRLVGSGISGRGGSVAAVTLNAGQVILTNAGNAATPAGNGTGELRINAVGDEQRSGNVELGGRLAFSGFSRVAITASASATAGPDPAGELRFTGPVAGAVGIDAAGADLSIDAARITADRGVRASGVTTGALKVAASSVTSDTRPEGLGSSLSMSARAIDFAGRVDLPGGVVQLNAQGAGVSDDVVLRQGSQVSVAGLTQPFGPVAADASAGQVRLASANGSVRHEAGARLDLRGAGERGDAGALSISAVKGAALVKGEVLTAPGSAARGAEVTIDAVRLDNISEIASALNGGAGGTSAESIALRARGGNIDLAAGDTLRAGRIALAADGGGGVTDGSVTIAGQLIARGEQGGRVDVHARNQITLKSGSLMDARPLDATPERGRDGGQVMLSARVTNDAAAPTTLDAIVVEKGARVDVAPTGDGAAGQITLRSNRVGNDVAVAALPGGALQGGRTVVEGVVVAPTINGALTVNIAGQQAVLQSYMSDANRAAMIARLGQGSNPSFSLRPGLEFRATGNITVAAPVDFALGLNPITGMGNFSYRYGGTSLDTSDPGALTLRAGGNLAVNANISDGFTTSGLNVNPFIKGNSWRYAFTAGADLAASDPRQVVAGGTGVLSIGLPTTDTAVRTGTGSISLSAASDVVLRNGFNRQANVVYTGGVRATDVPVFPSARGIAPVITKGGGSIDVIAGRDVLGADGSNAGSNQAVNEWLWRGGVGSEISPAVYWVNFGTFQQGFGALGGGNLTVRAGRDMLRVGAVVAGNGYSNGVQKAENNHGALDVKADGRIQQGLFFNQSGRFDVRAARIETDPARAFTRTRLAHGDNAVNVQVREQADLALPFNPTAFAPSTRLTPSLNVPDDYRSYMVTYGDQSSFSVRVAAGDLTANPFTLPNNPPSGSALLRSGDTLQFANVVAPSVDLIAFGGSIANLSVIRLFPAEDSSLRVLAGQDVTGLRATMSQADPARIASLSTPVIHSSSALDPLLPPRQGAVALHAGDTKPSAVVAATGSLAGLALDLVEATEIHAAKKISDGIGIEVQNANADSVTRISAGESIDLSRRDLEGWIRIYGPGAAEVISGGPIDLGANFGTSGILSRGNLRNVNLPNEGASLFVFGGTGVDAKGFALRPDYLNAVRAFVRSDAFAATGSDAARLNDEAIATLRRNPLYADLVAALDEGLKNRSAIDDPNSTVSMLLAKLSPAEVAEGSLRLAASVQEAANRRFVATKNTDTFAPGYAAFNDLFPVLSSNDSAVRSFVRSNPFAVAANGGDLRERALTGLSPEFVSVVRIGLADPASIDAPDSAFALALAKLTPEQLRNDSRSLLANTLAVAGTELDALRAGKRVDAGVGTPFAKGLSDFAASYSATGPVGANDIALFYSQIKAEQSGRVAVIDPRGSIVVGQSSAPVGVFPKEASELGIFTAGGGDIIGMARDNVDVFRSRVFTVAGGDVTLWSSLGNIDAGRGPRDVAVAPAPRIVVDEKGFVRLDIGGAVSGSGIGALKTRDDQAPSNIALIAPRGFIDAGEAGIRADTGTVTLGTNIVINAGNISASGGVSGGTVVAAAPPLPPNSALGGNAAERATEEARRAVAEEQNDAERRAQRSRKRVQGEFLGFGDDDAKDQDTKTK